MITAILFDFFGTLVEYSPSRVEQGYHATHELLLKEGVDISYAAFLENWGAVSEALDHWSQRTGHEYSMQQVAQHFLERVSPQPRSREFATRLWMSSLREWSTAIRYIPGVPELMQVLSARFRLGVVTNTHYAGHIHDHLCAIGISQHMVIVVTSIEHGRPKPHPSIFMSALTRLGCDASEALFVGDSYEADYLGATGVGMPALLIDPARKAPIPPQDAVGSVLDVLECAHLQVSRP
ncbi:MAG: HAD family hydrolase [Anaerolineae bacterium]|nr:HAD family hydrolase [Anaerolineae bacterium]